MVTAKNKMRKLDIFAVVGATIVLFVAGGTWWYMSSHEKPAEQQPAPITKVVKPTETEKQKPEVKIATKQELLDEVNKRRAEVGIAALKYSAALGQSAQQKCDDMVSRDYFTHADPNGKRGITLAEDNLRMTGQYGENLVAGIEPTAQSAFDQWFSSAPHKEAALEPRYTLTGFGICSPENFKYYIVEHFYSPIIF